MQLFPFNPLTPNSDQFQISPEGSPSLLKKILKSRLFVQRSRLSDP